jgi:hypothetical protein
MGTLQTVVIMLGHHVGGMPEKQVIMLGAYPLATPMCWTLNFLTAQIPRCFEACESNNMGYVQG